MAYKLELLVEVEHDIDLAVAYYVTKEKDIGGRFIDDWETSINYIVIHPLSFSKKKKSIRYALLKKFPYYIVYEVIKNKVVVYSVTFAKQNPKTIKSKIKTRKKL